MRDCSVEGTKAKHIFYFWFFIASLEKDRDKNFVPKFLLEGYPQGIMFYHKWRRTYSLGLNIAVFT